MANFHNIPMRYLCFFLFFLLLQLQGLQGQQSYVNNKQLDCQVNDTVTLGFVCNGVSTSCLSYLTFRTNPTFNNPAKVADLLGADASEIARINNISSTTNTIPIETLLVVPVNCSCSGQFYQYNTSYILENHSETYFSVANNTYQALTTCQSMIAQNSYQYRNLSVGTKLNIPLRCACPTANQTEAGFKYLLTYIVKERDTYTSIASIFNVNDSDSIRIANEIPPNDYFYFFTPLLIPLKSEPINLNSSSTSPPPPPPPPPPSPPSEDNNSSNKWLFIGIGIGVALLVLFLSGILIYCCCFHVPSPTKNQNLEESTLYVPAKTNDSNSWSETISFADAIGSLTIYKFDEITKATNLFEESNKIEGSVYKASFKGDHAAVKVMEGDVSSEINVLKQINHSNIVRLSGFCIHQGNTYLVYEYAENGSLHDWLHQDKKSTMLGWKQRIQIAYDAADALNYLHNYANPPYIHKNLKSSNILLDVNLRGKLFNFGLARELDKEGGLVMTRHVVGTHGYMAPEYIENGLVTPKLDVFALGVVMLELLSGKEAAQDDKEREKMLSEEVMEILGGDNVREKLRSFMDPCLGEEYPLDSAYAIAELANKCVSHDLNSRPTIAEVFFTLSKILSSSLDWDSSYELENSRSVGEGR